MPTEGLAPIHPEEFGAELRRAREQSELSLADIMAQTKISRRILESLEKGTFQFLPEHVFCRNFVRQCAEAIGSDPLHMVQLFDAAWEHHQQSSGAFPMLLVAEKPPPRPIRWHYWLPTALGVTILAASAVLILRGGPSDLPVVRERARGVVVEPSPTTLPVTTPSPVPPSAVGTEVAAATADGSVQLVVQVLKGQECWVRYRDREGKTGQQLLASEQSLELELGAPILLTLGNAGGIRLHIGQREYNDVGSPGEVVRAEVTPQGLVMLGVESDERGDL